MPSVSTGCPSQRILAVLGLAVALVGCRPASPVVAGPSAGSEHTPWERRDLRANASTWWLDIDPQIAPHLANGVQRIETATDGVSVRVLRDVAARSEMVGGRWVREVVDEEMATVRGRVAQQRVMGDTTPARTWQTGVGDCTEISDLLVARLQEAGIRARVAGGIAVREARPVWHAWVEYWDGRWATVDPTWAQHPVDVGHLRIDAAASSSALGVLNDYISGRAEGRLRAAEWRD